jgi:hypothetical protein
MNETEEKAMRLLDAIYDLEPDGDDDVDDPSVARAGELSARVAVMVEQGWAAYLDDLRTAREVHGTVPIQQELGRDVVLARLSALRGRYPDRVVAIGHQRLAKMTDGDLRSLLADIEELLASER